MKRGVFAQAALSALLVASIVGSARSETIFGGQETRDVSNWTTSSVAFDDTVQSGHSLNWENVLTNEADINLEDNQFEITWEAAVNHTIGHLFMYSESYDLAEVAGGMQGLLWHADLESSAFSNWSPVISVTIDGETRYYRWNHSGNDWNGNGKLNFSNPMNAVDDRNEFDLSQLGNASNGALGIWGELNAVAGNFATTRDNPIGPNLQGTVGVVQFGFLQWTSSSGSALDLQTISTSIDCFEVIINPDPISVPVLSDGSVENLTAVSATIQGEMLGFGNAYSDLSLYWGSSDGGDDANAWNNVIPLGVQFCAFDTSLEGLELDTTYYYRWYANNVAGGAFSERSGVFTTLSTLPPIVESSDGSSLNSSSAILVGEVTNTGNEPPAILIYYGKTDQGTNANAWDDFVELTPQGGAFSAEVDGLESDTVYFYRVFAENSAGGSWSASSSSVKTLAVGEPEVIVSDGISNSPGVATFSGEVVETGNELPEVTLFYGQSDGGTDPGAWSASIYLGSIEANFAEELSDLEGTTYYYRAFAENSAGASWSAETAMVEVMGFQGVSGSLGSDGFDFLYEMNENPSLLDLDGSGGMDWWTNPAMATGVDRTMLIPQNYTDGIARSNQAAGTPEALFRTDFTGSVSRNALIGDFSVEFSLRLIEGSQANPQFDLGGFSVLVNPPGMTSLKLNINEQKVTTSYGDNEMVVGSNADGFHAFRIAYVAADEKYWVWRDGVLILGGTTAPGGGIVGGESSIFAGGGLFFGDFSPEISGDWEVDYIRLHNAAVAPLGGDLRIVNSGFAAEGVFFIDFEGATNTQYVLEESSDLKSFRSSEVPFLNGMLPVTDERGVGRVELGLSDQLSKKLFFRLVKP